MPFGSFSRLSGVGGGLLRRSCRSFPSRIPPCRACPCACGIPRRDKRLFNRKVPFRRKIFCAEERVDFRGFREGEKFAARVGPKVFARACNIQRARGDEREHLVLGSAGISASLPAHLFRLGENQKGNCRVRPPPSRRTACATARLPCSRSRLTQLPRNARRTPQRAAPSCRGANAPRRQPFLRPPAEPFRARRARGIAPSSTQR